MRTRTASIILTAGLLSIANANVLFFEDFESYNPGDAPMGANPLDHNIVTTDPGTIFSENNQFVDLYGSAGTATQGFYMNQNISGMSGEILKFSFDFHEPGNVGSDPIFIGFAAENGDLNTAGAIIRVGLNNGAITLATFDGGTANPTGLTYNTDTAYHVTLIANDTGSAFAYNGVTLSGGEYGLWFDNAYAGRADIRPDRTLGSILFRKFNSQGTQQVYVDNVGVSVIPEPSAAVLMGLSLIAYAAFRRRA